MQIYEENPKYLCYCGKTQNPEISASLEPHSCGKVCGRKRGGKCLHLCSQICHKGKCKPCQEKGDKITCYCGKNEMRIKCSDDRNKFQCQEKCLKKLGCGEHFCQRNCHYGKCQPCQEKKKKKCFCKKTEALINCSEASYSCEDVCGKVLGCKNHTCK